MSLAALLKLIPFASAIVKAWRETVALFTVQQATEAGRQEAVNAGRAAAEAEEARADTAGQAAAIEDPMQPDEFMRKD